MQITPDQGAFMHWLVATLRATRAIEVGVFTGYSSIATATALGPGGKLLACDPDERALAVARRCWDRAGVLDRIVEHVRPARETLELLLSAGEAGQYDFAFVDADKRGYMGYYEQLLQLVRPGGVIAFDNVLWYGQVADAGATDARTEAIRELNSFLLADERILFSLLPISDGLALCTKK
ncbi:hypothetical protein ACKKBG_A23200 [Auxenochlorella protothecoides x Auxenochlorella symbiontica]|nr:putative caffeoyl-CoA O-methyltransferase 2 [Auxenochlorella protothecoides]KFM25377.1 putative caffeoyl-CoA O-methyltransferase 2 [Auxenochlorella protothecoides]RMZ56543.1 hypothetical protein APUTEX25_001390 [Auxenochlorella protothecoides]|eukprot:RMZ56543.1 hypothetical protein APUTEX25_001390 [Auxenochlorella protothecoides]